MSESKINMSLDQIISKNKPNSRGGRGGLRGTRGNMRGASRGGIRGASRGNIRGGNRGNSLGGNRGNSLGGRRMSTRLMNRRRPRFGSERKIIENNGPRNNMNNKVNLFSLFEK